MWGVGLYFDGCGGKGATLRHGAILLNRQEAALERVLERILNFLPRRQKLGEQVAPLNGLAIAGKLLKAAAENRHCVAGPHVRFDRDRLACGLGPLLAALVAALQDAVIDVLDRGGFAVAIGTEVILLDPFDTDNANVPVLPVNKKPLPQK